MTTSQPNTQRTPVWVDLVTPTPVEFPVSVRLPLDRRWGQHQDLMTSARSEYVASAEPLPKLDLPMHVESHRTTMLGRVRDTLGMAAVLGRLNRTCGITPSIDTLADWPTEPESLTRLLGGRHRAKNVAARVVDSPN